MLLGLQVGLVDRGRDLGLTDDEKCGLAMVDEFAEIPDIGTRHALPQMATDTADTGADDGGTDERGWEQDSDDRTDGRASPCAVTGRRLVLVHVHLAVIVLGDHGSVVRADRALA